MLPARVAKEHTGLPRRCCLCASRKVRLAAYRRGRVDRFCPLLPSRTVRPSVHPFVRPSVRPSVRPFDRPPPHPPPPLLAAPHSFLFHAFVLSPLRESPFVNRPPYVRPRRLFLSRRATDIEIDKVYPVTSARHRYLFDLRARSKYFRNAVSSITVQTALLPFLPPILSINIVRSLLHTRTSIMYIETRVRT